jgi:hypothetical protein
MIMATAISSPTIANAPYLTCQDGSMLTTQSGVPFQLRSET